MRRRRTGSAAASAAIGRVQRGETVGEQGRAPAGAQVFEHGAARGSDGDAHRAAVAGVGAARPTYPSWLSGARTTWVMVRLPARPRSGAFYGVTRGAVVAQPSEDPRRARRRAELAGRAAQQHRAGPGDRGLACTQLLASATICIGSLYKQAGSPPGR